MENNRDYLGDSVHAQFDGFGIVLTTDNGFGPSNEIYLEPEVLSALNRYADRMRKIAAQHKAEQSDK